MSHRRHRRVGGAFAALVVVAILAVSLVGVPSAPAVAAAPPIVECNNDAASNVGGQGIACSVVIDNRVEIAVDGTLAVTAPATVTVTKCVGAAGPIAAGGGTCTTTTTTYSDPITIVQLCNGSGNGGGGVLRCSLTLVNAFNSAAIALTPATVYQCIGSVITGPGAPGTCSPVNTPGVTSITAARWASATAPATAEPTWASPAR